MTKESARKEHHLTDHAPTFREERRARAVALVPVISDAMRRGMAIAEHNRLDLLDGTMPLSPPTWVPR